MHTDANDTQRPSLGMARLEQRRRANAKYRKNNKAKRHALQAAYRQTPRGRFTVHKTNAKRRGIPFLFTFETWLHFWKESGKWDERGNVDGGYVMCRIGDEGAYGPGNVYIGTHNDNVAERNTLYARKRHTAKTTTVTFHEPELEDCGRSIYGAVTPPF